jgi:hypothetical protein
VHIKFQHSVDQQVQKLIGGADSMVISYTSSFSSQKQNGIKSVLKIQVQYDATVSINL